MSGMYLFLVCRSHVCASLANGVLCSPPVLHRKRRQYWNRMRWLVESACFCNLWPREVSSSASATLPGQCCGAWPAFSGFLTPPPRRLECSPCRHPTSWIHNKPWLLGFGGSCRCSRTRARIIVQGTFSAATGQAFDAACRPSAVGVYGRTPLVGESVSAFVATTPVPLLRRMAAGSLEASRGSVDVFPLSRVAGASVALSELCDPTEVVCAEPRLSHDDPEWIGEIADSLPFREVLRYKLLRPGHINVLEARMYKTFQKYCARHHPSSRTLGLLDSRVTLGAVARGRSSSPALSRVLQGTLPYTLGSGLYSGGLHVYSSKNRADGPSRNRALEPPTKEVPVWYSDLCAGKHWRFDVACAASRCSKLCARWLRLLLLLGGDRTESRALALGASGSAGPPRLEVRLYSDHRGSYAQVLGCLYDLGAR